MTDRLASGTEQPSDGLDDLSILFGPDGPEVEQHGVAVDSGENSRNLMAQSPRRVIWRCRGTAEGQELCRYRLDRDSAAPYLRSAVLHSHFEAGWQRFSQPARNPAGPPLQALPLHRPPAAER